MRMRTTAAPHWSEQIAGQQNSVINMPGVLDM
jgi:hypothetical protein